MNKVIVVIRRSKNYTPWMEIDSKIQWWNEVFKIPFLEFRRELSNIAFNNHDEIKADKIYYTIDDFKNDLDSITPQDWILPIDDDDWLCNGVCSKIQNTITNSDCLSWKTNVISVFSTIPPNWTLEKIQAHIYQNESKEKYPLSCCYSLRGNSASFDNLMHHMKVSGVIREYDENIESCYLVLPQSTLCLHKYIETKDILVESAKKVELLDEDLLSHRPEFVSKLRLIKDLFKQL